MKAVPHDAQTHIESYSRAPRGAWYHSEAHPVHALFKRDVATPGSQGKPFETLTPISLSVNPSTLSEWTAQYPAVYSPPIPEAVTPKLWLDALQSAEQGGQIPNIPIPTQAKGQNPNYGGQDPSGSGPEICSSTTQCRGPGDEWDGPDGHLGIGFDDGPSDVIVFCPYCIVVKLIFFPGFGQAVPIPSRAEPISYPLHDRY